MNKYLIVTECHDRADINYGTNSLDDAKHLARVLASANPKNAHTFIVLGNEWAEGNYKEISF